MCPSVNVLGHLSTCRKIQERQDTALGILLDDPASAMPRQTPTFCLGTTFFLPRRQHKTGESRVASTYLGRPRTKEHPGSHGTRTVTNCRSSVPVAILLRNQWVAKLEVM